MTPHLEAIKGRLSRERSRLADAKTEREHKMRLAWVKQAEKELADEIAFLASNGIALEAEKTDAEILADLGLMTNTPSFYPSVKSLFIKS